VFLVVDSETVGEPYALKSVSKAQIIEQNLEKHLLQEKMVLEQTHFPFIMTFYRTFKDSMSVYFLTKYIQGMELFDAIREIGLLNTYES
jgi:cGMP-dependent protein kinase